MVEMYAVYQKKHGGSTGATDPDTYLLKGLFASYDRANRVGDDIVRGHDYYEKMIQPVKIPDEAIAIMVASAMDNLSAEELKSIVDET